MGKLTIYDENGQIMRWVILKEDAYEIHYDLETQDIKKYVNGILVELTEDESEDCYWEIEDASQEQYGTGVFGLEETYRYEPEYSIEDILKEGKMTLQYGDIYYKTTEGKWICEHVSDKHDNYSYIEAMRKLLNKANIEDTSNIQNVLNHFIDYFA